MKREIITTKDGSTSILIPDWDEAYHSRHGAIQEARHVFIRNGLQLFDNRPVSILEIGFGTGLNAFITFLESAKTGQRIIYTGVEAYPISVDESLAMNFVNELDARQHQAIYDQMHHCAWQMPISLSSEFTLIKRRQFFEQVEDVSVYDLIYFDAFGYDVQPELWSTDIFRRMYEALKPGGILVTYAARGVVKRSMMAVGFLVEKLPGPPGKREMFRARKS